MHNVQLNNHNLTRFYWWIIQVELYYILYNHAFFIIARIKGMTVFELKSILQGYFNVWAGIIEIYNIELT